MDSYMESVGFGKPIGIHIRRTDNKRCIENSPDELFYEKINQILDNDRAARIFLCTDDDNLKHNMCSKYKDNIITREISTRYSPNGIEDAAIDVFLLSKCNKLYGSQSGFVKLAADIGGVPLEILDLKSKKVT